MVNETLSAKIKYQMALDVLRPFCKKSIPFATFQAGVTLLALATLVLLSYYLYELNPIWSILIAPFTTMFLCRSYVIEHDCGHQSFFRKKSTNALVGNIFGFLNMIPYEMWRYIHDSSQQCWQSGQTRS
jgi:omega-6 fatty acid desaturase (delta-12 desaturase)